ncbi:MAG: ornithine carbamoyltransferase, partial [Pseudomonadales bacterium]|nr:ornithine carbamoyltransferase [Pseudomonadales bacterium]
MSIRHFLTLQDLSSQEFKQLLLRATELKQMLRSGVSYQPFKNSVMAMIFEKSSTRTRISFEAGMTQLGGHAMFLSPTDTQLGRGEPIEDSARVMSRMVDIIMIRTFDQAKIERFAQYSRVPVINALTDQFHPCQLLADMQTFQEHRGPIRGKTVCYIGDGNNMCNSYINAASLLDFHLHIACPSGFEPMPSLLEKHSSRVTLFRHPQEAVQEAHLVVTDVWASMGQEQEQAERVKKFAGFQVSPALM